MTDPNLLSVFGATQGPKEVQWTSGLSPPKKTSENTFREPSAWVRDGFKNKIASNGTTESCPETKKLLEHTLWGCAQFRLD